MTRTRLAIACLSSGIGWSVSYLAVVEVFHHMVGANAALLLAWPLKIAWSTVHTWVSRWRGSRAITLSVSTA